MKNNNFIIDVRGPLFVVLSGYKILGRFNSLIEAQLEVGFAIGKVLADQMEERIAKEREALSQGMWKSPVTEQEEMRFIRN